MYPPRQVHLKISVREQHHGREQKFVSSFSHRYSISQKELSPTPHRGHWKFVTFNNLNPPLCTTKNHLVCGERGVPKVVQGANIRNHMKLLEIKIVRFEMGLFPTCRSVSANADASPHFTLSPPFLQISYCYSCHDKQLKHQKVKQNFLIQIIRRNSSDLNNSVVAGQEKESRFKYLINGFYCFCRLMFLMQN